jgi:hypothetical protein
LAVPAVPGLFGGKVNTRHFRQIKGQNGRGNNLQILLFYLFEPRANLTSLMTSVPELTNLILSMFGTKKLPSSNLSLSVGIQMKFPILLFYHCLYNRFKA